MQASARQQELERLYNARKGHVPQISISDDSHHITEAIGSYYETDEGAAGLAAPGTPHSPLRESRPLSFVPGARETYDTRSRRQGTYLEGPPSGLRIDTSNVSSRRASPPAASRRSPRSPQRNDQQPISPPPTDAISPHRGPQLASPKFSVSPKQNLHRAATVGAESAQYASASSPAQPPPLNRSSSAETAVQQFPLNDIDYETSPAAVAQELSNLQAIRRMSMNVDTADPDLPLFSGSFSSIPSSPSRNSDDENDPSKLFWVPARLHPELAPKEFKTFIEDRVEKIRRRSGGGGEDGLLSDGLERSGSDSSLRRKKSMLSHQIDARGHYEDGADRLSRKRPKGMQVEAQTTVGNLSELESLVNDPAQLLRRMSLDKSRRSVDSGVDVPKGGDVILPGAGSLKRSTRTTYRKQSLKNGERFPKRGQHRHTDSDVEESPISPTGTLSEEPEPIMGILRAQTDPGSRTEEYHANFSRPSQRYRNAAQPTVPTPPAPQTQEEYSLQDTQWDDQDEDAYTDSHEHEVEPPSSQPPPQPRQFQSRIASQGRTTAQLPGYTNTNPLPNVIDTLPDGSKVPSQGLIQQLPPRKSSHEIPRQFQRGLPVRSSSAARQTPPTTGPTFDDIAQASSIPPGNTSTRTDALAIVPTLTEEKKAEKKEPTKKSGWKWILGNDDDKSKDDKSSDSKSKTSKKGGADKARLDVLQNSIDGTTPARGRESLVLSRDDIIIEEPTRSKASKKSESRKDQPGLLSALFGGKKKSFDSEQKDKKRKGDRNLLSPDHVYRPLKPDIDYNWTRFSILEERAIYRMAHLKLANPRRALHSQVLLSNFMYSYLAKVQLMHPQIQIPPAQQRAQQRGQPKSSDEQQQSRQQSQQQQKPAEYNQYQQWQEQQARQEAATTASSPDQNSAVGNAARTSAEHHHHHEGDILSDEDDNDGRVSGDYDLRRSSEDDHRPQSSSASGGYGHYQPQPQSQQQQHYRPSTSSSYSSSTRGAPAVVENQNASLGGGYSVSSTHDYLGYRHDEQPFGNSGGHDGGLWDDDEDEKEGEMW